MRIFDREIGPGHPALIIAEIGLCHGGSLDAALEMIHAAAEAGAGVVKFQKRNVDTLAIPAVLDAPVDDPRFPNYGGTYRQLREAHEFGMDEYRKLKAFADAIGLGFLVTAFDCESVDFLEELGVSAYKIASMSVTNIPLINRIARTGKPAIMSTGMATMEEVDTAVDVLTNGLADALGKEREWMLGTTAPQFNPRPRGAHPFFWGDSDYIGLLHCVSEYPMPPERANLRQLDTMRGRYHSFAIGYSGHEQGWIPTLAAVARGADIVERHFTLDKTQPGFDHALSLEPDEFAQMVRDIRTVEAVLGDGVKRITEGEQRTRDKYRPSIAARVDIPAGAVITEDMLYLTNPGTGLHPAMLGSIVGQMAVADIPGGTLVESEQVARQGVFP